MAFGKVYLKAVMSNACQMGWITALGWLAGAVLFIALPDGGP